MLNENIHQREWLRLECYAYRVRSLSIGNILTSVHPSVYPILAQATQGRVLFPRLTTLEFNKDRVMDYASMHFIAPLLVSTTLQKLELALPKPPRSEITRDNLYDMPSGSDAVDREELVSKILDPFSVGCRELLVLVVDTGMQPLPSMRPIAKFQNLQTLDVRCVSVADVLRYRSEIPTLTSLSVMLVYDPADAMQPQPAAQPQPATKPQPLPSTCFSKLQSLTVTGRDLEVVKLIGGLSRTTLPYLHITVDFQLPPDGNAFSAALAAKCATMTALRAISIYYRSPQDHPLSGSLFSNVVPLLSLHNLEDVTISFISAALDVTDDDMQMLATAWSKLRALTLSWDVFDREVQLTPTSTSLLGFARGCPQLRKLGLSYVDLTDVGEPASWPSASHSLQQLDVEFGYDDDYAGLIQQELDPETTAKFLNCVFPTVMLSHSIYDRLKNYADVLGAVWEALQQERKTVVQEVIG